MTAGTNRGCRLPKLLGETGDRGTEGALLCSCGLLKELTFKTAISYWSHTLPPSVPFPTPFVSPLTSVLVSVGFLPSSKLRGFLAWCLGVTAWLSPQSAREAAARLGPRSCRWRDSEGMAWDIL